MNKTSIERDFDKRTLTIRRRFNAPRHRVWRAYTEPELLDRWWAPQPWKTQTVRMDFRVGGHWLYTMNGPEGQRHYCRMDFLEIEPETRFLTDDVFADETGATDTAMPQQQFDTMFSDEGETTLVTVVSRYPSVEDLKTVIEMGIEQGVTMAQDQLEALFAAGDL